MRLNSLLSVAVAGLFITCPVMADEAPIGDEINQLPIFDAHMHYHEPAWSEVSPSLVIKMMNRNKVSRSLLSSAPDQGTIQLFEYAPNRFIPEASPYHDHYRKSNWAEANVDYMMAYLTDRLDQYPHQGMGELIIHSYDLRYAELIRRIAKLAKSRNLLLHLHADSKVVDLIYRHAPGVTIVWAHAGMVDPPDVVRQTMNKYPSLYADLSYREDEILVNDKLNPQWKAVLIEHVDRFMVGSDTWTNNQWANYDELIETNRRWLALMPRSVAEAIAYRNAERVFKRSMSDELIGVH